MTTTIPSISVDTQDRPLDTVPARSSRTATAPAATSGRTNPLPDWGWVLFVALFAFAVVVVGAAVIHAHAPTRVTESGRLIDGASIDRGLLVRGYAGNLVDGNGLPVIATGSTRALPGLDAHPHLAGAHVIGASAWAIVRFGRPGPM